MSLLGSGVLDKGDSDYDPWAVDNASAASAALGGDEDVDYLPWLFADQTRTMSRASDLAIPFGSIFLIFLIPVIFLTMFLFFKVSSKRLSEDCQSAAGPVSSCFGKCVPFRFTGSCACHS